MHHTYLLSFAPAACRLADLLRRRLFRSNGRDQVGIPITRQSQANDLEISDGVRALLPELNRGLPEGTRLEVAVDFTVFTRHALEEVWYTMGICLFVVGLVNFIFLGTWRAAIIPGSSLLRLPEMRQPRSFSVSSAEQATDAST